MGMRVWVLWVRVRVAVETPEGYPCNSLFARSAEDTWRGVGLKALKTLPAPCSYYNF